MKVQYDKQSDIFTIELNEKKVDHAFENRDMIVHVSEDNMPVLLEIFNAKKFFADQSKALPAEIKEKYFTAI